MGASCFGRPPASDHTSGTFQKLLQRYGTDFCSHRWTDFNTIFSDSSNGSYPITWTTADSAQISEPRVLKSQGGCALRENLGNQHFQAVRWGHLAGVMTTMTYRKHDARYGSAQLFFYGSSRIELREPETCRQADRESP